MTKVPKSITIENETLVWKMRQKSYTYERIAQETGLSVGGVNKILGRLNKRYKKANEESHARLKDEQLSQLEYICNEAMDAWERSKENSITLRKKAIGSQAGGVSSAVEQTQESKDQDGDPRYLKEARDALSDIRKIIGADAPVKSENKNSVDVTGGSVVVYIPDNGRDDSIN